MAKPLWRQGELRSQALKKQFAVYVDNLLAPMENVPVKNDFLGFQRVIDTNITRRRDKRNKQICFMWFGVDEEALRAREGMNDMEA